MKKNAAPKKVAPNLSGLTRFIVAIAVLTLIEATLIIAGALPPISSYSPGNLLFALAKIAVVIYAGVVFAKQGQGLKKAALNGAILGLTTALTAVLVSLASKPFFNKPILGLSSPNAETLIVLFAVIIMENAVISGIVAALAAWAALRRSPRRSA